MSKLQFYLLMGGSMSLSDAIRDRCHLNSIKPFKFYKAVMIDIRNTSKLSVRLLVTESTLGIQENWNDTM